MMRKMLALLAAAMLVASVLGGTALAADDRPAPDAAKRTFIPTRELSVADAVGMLVDGFKLNLDHIRFIKKPEAGDYFSNVPNDAPYAWDFIVAHLNGLPLPADVDPEAKITREFYAHLLFHAMLTKGEFVFIQIYKDIADQDEIDDRYMDSIQKMLISGIAKLDKNGRFHPKAPVRAGIARGMLLKAVRYAAKHAAPPTETSPGDEEVKVGIMPVADGVNKVTLSWGTKPNPGYAIAITKVEFTEPGRAIIFYELHYPDPDKMYPQVIVEPTASVYLDSNLKPEARMAENR